MACGRLGTFQRADTRVDIVLIRAEVELTEGATGFVRLREFRIDFVDIGGERELVEKTYLGFRTNF
jgi:hypothetical protein